MFTGIIQGLGKIKNFSSGKLLLSTDLNLEDCKIGSSISCNGICLTAINIKKENNKFILTLNVGEETQSRTNLQPLLHSNLKFINLEKSLTIGSEISGHFVYGHIDLLLLKLLIYKN